MTAYSPPDLDHVFHALADATRRELLDGIAQNPGSTVSQLAAPYAMSLAAVSKHIQVLETAGVVHKESVGCERRCYVDAERLAAAHDWIATYRRFWENRLDELEAHVTGKKKQATRSRRRKKP